MAGSASTALAHPRGRIPSRSSQLGQSARPARGRAQDLTPHCSQRGSSARPAPGRAQDRTPHCSQLRRSERPAPGRAQDRTPDCSQLTRSERPAPGHAQDRTPHCSQLTRSELPALASTRGQTPRPPQAGVSEQKSTSSLQKRGSLPRFCRLDVSFSLLQLHYSYSILQGIFVSFSSTSTCLPPSDRLYTRVALNGERYPSFTVHCSHGDQ
eukprot:358164-Chlamydomonas_euryale.AAC.5